MVSIRTKQKIRKPRERLTENQSIAALKNNWFTETSIKITLYLQKCISPRSTSEMSSWGCHTRKSKETRRWSTWYRGRSWLWPSINVRWTRPKVRGLSVTWSKFIFTKVLGHCMFIETSLFLSILIITIWNIFIFYINNTGTPSSALLGQVGWVVNTSLLPLQFNFYLVFALKRLFITSWLLLIKTNIDIKKFSKIRMYFFVTMSWNNAIYCKYYNILHRLL